MKMTYAEFEKAIEEKQENLDTKIAKKCEKRGKKLEKIYKYMETDKERFSEYLAVADVKKLAMTAYCTSN